MGYNYQFECPPKRDEQTWKEYAKETALENQALKRRISELTDKMQLIINYRLEGGIDEGTIVRGLLYDHPLSPKVIRG